MTPKVFSLRKREDAATNNRNGGTLQEEQIGNSAGDIQSLEVKCGLG